MELNELSILLVDDNKVNQFLGKRILSNLGVSEIDLASNGKEAFEMCNNKQYHVVLTDVEMPEMNGHELAKSIRKNIPYSSSVIIIALTANAADEDRILASEAGINDYLTKPYHPQDLMHVIQKNMLDRKPFMIEQFEETNQTNSSLNGMDEVYKIFKHNRDDIKQFLHMLSYQIPELIQQIKQSIIEENYEIGFQASHKLKSPIKLLSNIGLSDKLGQLSDDFKSEKSMLLLAEDFEIIAPQLESIVILINTELESITAE